MFPQLLRTTVILFLTGLSFAFALDEVEPNDDLNTATDATGTTIIRGEIESGANTRYDYFRIHKMLTFQFNLHAEARILTGPFAGSENFTFELQVANRPPYGSNPLIPFSVASGNGSRVIHRDSEFGPYGTLLLAVGFPPEITSGTYEIRYTLVPDSTREVAPSISTEVRRARGSDRVLVKIDTNTLWNSPMHRVTARAGGHPKAIIVSNYFGTKYINTKRGPDYYNASGYDLDYRLRLERRVTRLVITAEDSGGLQSTETLVFRKNVVSRYPRSSSLPGTN